MNFKVWSLFILFVLLTGCWENEPYKIADVRYVDGDEFSKQFNGIESQILSSYPSEIDSIIDVKLCLNQNIEYYEKQQLLVYHPAVMGYTIANGVKTEYGPLVDTTTFVATIWILTLNDEEIWQFEFDTNMVCQSEMKR